jgi:PAS domain S-box-containing protein
MVLPEGWQYSNICAAKIQYGNLIFKTPNFKEGCISQGAEFRVNDREIGKVEVVYLEETPEEVEGPFLFEERNLINVIAEMLQSYLVRKGREEELKVSQANLRATINNTEILIWSVDRAFNLLTFNEPFERHVRENYGYDVAVGVPLFPGTVSEEGSALSRDWHTYFLRALSGEIVRAEGNRLGRYFNYSLSPIIENSKVIGVSMFADDITDQKEREKALADAQVKISELRLAALRSVMNPHFVFNALNSIQYFIAKNDRLNAINYLSTFSKLIRGILTNSLNNTIRLSEEVELLKHYLNLEMIRFEDKFSFEIDLKNGIDLENIEIPSLLIQPYVENAILHGLYNKSEPGKLKISIQEIGDAVLFEIEDNGIGRDAAMKLRSKNFPNHKSMGVAVTEERLKLINSKRKISFQIEDLMDGDAPAGTRIKIWITI